MKIPGRLSIAVAMWLVASAAYAQADGLQLSIKDGRVTLVADNVQVRTILEEWARIGDTRIVNAEKLVGPPVTLRLENVAERDALDTVLRSAAGYLVAPRPPGVPGTSVFDRVLILASSRAPVSTGRSANMPPTFSPPPMSPPIPTEDDQSESDDTTAPETSSPPMLPYPGPFPGSGAQPPPGQPQQPLTSPKPGFLPAPQPGANPPALPLPPGYPGSPTPVPPRKPGGGGGRS